MSFRYLFTVFCVTHEHIVITEIKLVIKLIVTAIITHECHSWTPSFRLRRVDKT